MHHGTYTVGVSASGVPYVTRTVGPQVASYLALDLNLDWRHGADHFESLLLDYDPCSNWGNWAAAAGLTGGRVNRFNIVKQSKDYDAAGDYVRSRLRTPSLTGCATMTPTAAPALRPCGPPAPTPAPNSAPTSTLAPPPARSATGCPSWRTFPRSSCTSRGRCHAPTTRNVPPRAARTPALAMRPAPAARP